MGDIESDTVNRKLMANSIDMEVTSKLLGRKITRTTHGFSRDANGVVASSVNEDLGCELFLTCGAVIGQPNNMSVHKRLFHKQTL